MRVLVTGASGFIGRHLLVALDAHGAEVVACGRPNDGTGFFPLDVGDVLSLQTAFRCARPELVVHLAGQASVGDSLSDPATTFELNVEGTRRLIEATIAYREESGSNPRVILASTAEVYGMRTPQEMPLRESLELRPENPYAKSKMRAETLLFDAVEQHGLDAFVVRFFNLIGPGQDERFVVSRFAHRLAAIVAGAPPQLGVGNLTVARDFLDVRDAVEILVALVQLAASGQAYNICTGTATRVRDILRELILCAHIGVEVVEDPNLVRLVDIPLIAGDPGKIRALGIASPTRTLVETLRDVYHDARGRIAGAESSVVAAKDNG